MAKHENERAFVYERDTPNYRVFVADKDEKTETLLYINKDSCIPASTVLKAIISERAKRPKRATFFRCGLSEETKRELILIEAMDDGDETEIKLYLHPACARIYRCYSNSSCEEWSYTGLERT